MNFIEELRWRGMLQDMTPGTEEQLNKHGGKVRCGQCLQIFDAKSQLVSSATDSIEDAASPSISFKDIMAPTEVSNADEKPHESKAAADSSVNISSTVRGLVGLC